MQLSSGHLHVPVTRRVSRQLRVGGSARRCLLARPVRRQWNMRRCRALHQPVGKSALCPSDRSRRCVRSRSRSRPMRERFVLPHRERPADHVCAARTDRSGVRLGLLIGPGVRVYARDEMHRCRGRELRKVQEELLERARLPVRWNVRVSVDRPRGAELLLCCSRPSLRANGGLLRLVERLSRPVERSSLRRLHRGWARHVWSHGRLLPRWIHLRRRHLHLPGADGHMYDGRTVLPWPRVLAERSRQLRGLPSATRRWRRRWGW